MAINHMYYLLMIGPPPWIEMLIAWLVGCLQLFDFADKYRGRYDSSITVARKYYASSSGYGVCNAMMMLS